MGKEKEMLKTILANTEAIMAHLKIGKPTGATVKPKAPAKKAAKRPTKKPAGK